MYASVELLARRDQLVDQARNTLAPLQQWWEQFGHDPCYTTSPTSYFNGRIHAILQDQHAEIERIAHQHPRYITEQKLDDFAQHYGHLPDAWQRLVAEAYVFEQLRAAVIPSNRDPEALTEDIHYTFHAIAADRCTMRDATPYAGRIPAAAPLLAQVADLEEIAKKVKKRADEVFKDYHLTHWRDPARPDILPDQRFKIEHDLRYLKHTETRVQEMLSQFTALHTPVADLTQRVQTALAEWRGILGLLEASPLTTQAWHLHDQLHALTQHHLLSVPDLECTYEDSKRAVHAAFDAQFVRRTL